MIRSPASMILAAACAFAVVMGLIVAKASGAEPPPRVIVIGFDGLDYDLLQKMMAEGRVPNFERLATTGTFDQLGTSVPPQSPVAWSNFITGMDSGGHGIFDFIHRDPKTLVPYLSTSRSIAGDPTFNVLGLEIPAVLRLGKYCIPLRSGRVELLRQGQAFWEVLEQNGVETTIIRCPANFPPSGTATRELSGMGTPDIVGNSGTFSFYTTDYDPFVGKKISGGHVYEVKVRDGVVKSSIYGPTNDLLCEKEKAKVDFTVYVDPEAPVARIVIGSEERILNQGEWTEWLGVDMELMPGNELHGMCRFYLQEVRPEFRLYVSSVDFDPIDPAVPISTPPDFAKELAEATGRFYTEEMPEDTKALSEGVFTMDEFLHQAELAGSEVRRQYEWVLDRYPEGFLFYYFGNQDQIAHMLLGNVDPGHPVYKEVNAKYADVIPTIIEGFDEIVGVTLDRMGDDDVLIVMSDHGFASWRRAMSLNSWLRDEGYLVLKDPNPASDPGFLLNVDWTRTKAYGLGLNGLYINQRGREKRGIVNASDKRALLEEIGAKLLQVVDPATGQRAVTKAYISEDTYQDRGHLDVGPDMQVGYAEGTRANNKSALGSIPDEVFSDNEDQWSADHCMDHEAVPGVLLTSRPLKKPAPRLENLAAAILAEYGIEGFAGDAEKREQLKSIGYISAAD